MKRFIEGEDRYQSTLFPEVVDDYVGGDNHVRVIEAFIDELMYRFLSSLMAYGGVTDIVT